MLLLGLSARKFAQKTIDLQQEAFRSWGVMADWDKYYTTYSREYQINQLDVFHQMYDKVCVENRAWVSI